MKVILQKSTRKGKKYMVIVDDKRVHFGATGYEDFTIHKDPKRKENYIKRHKKREEKFWMHTRDNLFRPSYWARYLLWNKETILASARDINAKQNIKIIINGII